MPDISNLAHRANAARVAVNATVANTVAAAAEDLYVLVPAFDGGRQRFGPCPFMPRGDALPTRGDSCLVIFDDEGDPWVAVWSET